MTEANTIPLDYGQVRAKFHENAGQRRAAIEDHKREGERRAHAEAAYRKALALKFAKARSEGKSVKECEIEVRGDLQVLEHSLERDMADVAFKNAYLRVGQTEAERAGLNRLAEWAGRLDPTGMGE